MYTVQFRPYCGLSMPRHEFDNAADARAYAAERIRIARDKGREVTTDKPGRSWEFLAPDDCMMIPDDAGMLVLGRVTWECRECGCAHETADDAAACCAYDYETEEE